MKFYPLADSFHHVSPEIRGQLGITKKRGGGLIWVGSGRVRAIKTSEKRCPQKGEWYLSGAIPRAWYAKNDLSTEYHIVELVKTKDIEVLDN